MGKAKRSTGKNTGKKKKKIKKDAYVQAIVVIIFSLLLAVLIYGQTGTLGRGLSKALGGLIGWIKYLVPIGTFIVGIVLTKEAKELVIPKIIQFLVIILCICGTMSLVQISKKELNTTQDFNDIISQSYDYGEINKGGGAIGALIAIPMNNTIGAASYVVLIGTGILLSIFTFGIKPAELIDKMSERLQNREYEDEDDDEEEEEEPRKRVKQKQHEEPRRTREKPKKSHSVIMENLFDDDEDETGVKKKYDHDIPLAFDEKGEEEEPKKKTKIKEKQRRELEEEEEEVQKEDKGDFIEANLFKEKKEEKEEHVKQELQLEHSQEEIDENYEFPPIALLELGEGKKARSKTAVADNALRLQKTLHSFGVSAKVEDVSVGPAITRYELRPAEGVRVNKIANLADDIALNLAAQSIRIEAPIPGKQAVGIEIPNEDTEMVHLRDILDSEDFVKSESKLSMGLGKDVSGKRVIADIAKMPHLLVAGSTGSGKSVCINTLITSLIYKAKPSEVKLIMVDPKIVELSVYNGIPHLLIPVVTDPRKAAGALAWSVQEMEERYAKFAAKGVRDIKGYNRMLESEGEDEGARKLPQIVIIIDELADLMMVAAKDVEDAICRLAQKARAAGMHLVIATQRPSVDVITGVIKANIPSRIAFAVSSQIDSRTILDTQGAEKLLGKGDMLYYPTGMTKPLRVQGTFVSDKEVEKIVDFLKKDGEATYNEDIIESIEKANKTDKEKEIEADEDDDTDPRLNEAIEYVLEQNTASASFLQRRMKVGYARAGRIIDQMAERGIISGYQGSKPREVLITKERWEELNSQPHIEEAEEQEESTEE